MQLAIHVSPRVSPQQTNWRSAPHKYVPRKHRLEGMIEMGCASACARVYRVNYVYMWHVIFSLQLKTKNFRHFRVIFLLLCYALYMPQITLIKMCFLGDASIRAAGSPAFLCQRHWNIGEAYSTVGSRPNGPCAM